MTSRHLVTQSRIELIRFKLGDEIVTDLDRMVTMRDGVDLCVNIFRPRQPGRYPVIIAMTPYGKDHSNHGEFYRKLPNAHLGRLASSEPNTFEAPEPAYWVPNGYVVIQGDTRGQGKSRGDSGPFHHEDQRDYYDLIEWAGAQDWSNGNVGLSGVSYLAVSQWSVAPLRPPHLKAIVPWEGWNDFYLKFHFGGIPETGFMKYLYDAIVIPKHNARDGCGWIEPDILEHARQHPLRDEYWRYFDYDLEKIDVPALVCASFSDQGLHTRDTFEGFKRISSREKWLFNHRRPKWEAYYREDGLTAQKRFLDHFLKGVDNGIERAPRVRLEVNESRDVYKIIHCRQWPVEGTQYVPFYLDSGKAALNRQPVAAEHFIAYASDGSGQAVFDFAFDADIDIIGNTKLKLWVAAEEADDIDLFVGIKKFDSAGDEVYFYGLGGTNPNDIVARGWLRVSHRELDPRRSTPWQPVLKHQRRLMLKPGEIVAVEIEILPSGTTFRKGDTLRVVVQGVRITPDRDSLVFSDVINRGRHRIYTGGQYDSHVLLPVVDTAALAGIWPL